MCDLSNGTLYLLLSFKPTAVTSSFSTAVYFSSESSGKANNQLIDLQPPRVTHYWNVIWISSHSSHLWAENTEGRHTVTETHSWPWTNKLILDFTSLGGLINSMRVWCSAPPAAAAADTGPFKGHWWFSIWAIIDPKAVASEDLS